LRPRAGASGGRFPASKATMPPGRNAAEAPATKICRWRPRRLALTDPAQMYKTLLGSRSSQPMPADAGCAAPDGGVSIAEPGNSTLPGLLARVLFEEE